VQQGENCINIMQNKPEVQAKIAIVLQFTVLPAYFVLCRARVHVGQNFFSFFGVLSMGFLCR